MAEDNELKPNADDAAGTPAGDAPVEELSWEHVETYQPVSTDASDSETVFATRTDEVGATPAATPVAAPAAGPAQAADTAATNPYATVERQPVPTYMPAGATPPAGSAYAGPYTAAPGGPGTPAGNNPYAASGGYGTPMPQPQPQRPSSGKAVGALVCGILAILFSETVIVGIILGIVALVLGRPGGARCRQGRQDHGREGLRHHRHRAVGAVAGGLSHPIRHRAGLPGRLRL